MDPAELGRSLDATRIVRAEQPAPAVLAADPALDAALAMRVAAWWINHDRDPSPEPVDQVATELSTDHAAVRHIFTTLWPTLIRSKRGA